MGLRTNKTILIHTRDGVIKVTPQGRRTNIVSAPAHIRLTDRKGRKLTKPPAKV